MKNLILIRHGKSGWDNPVSDKHRDLLPKGIDNSILVARSTREKVLDNAAFWSSAATRAHKTALIFLNEWNINPEKLVVKEALYTFDFKNLQQQITQCTDEYDTLIIFGHNNAITDFVNQFGSEYIENVATSGFVNLEFETNTWKNIKHGTTKHVVFAKHLL